MADGDVAFEAAERTLIEDLGDEPHIGEDVYLLPVGGGYTGTLLTAMLQGEEGKKGKPSYILTGSIYTENAASFVQYL